MVRPTPLLEAALSVCRNYLEVRDLVGLTVVDGRVRGERWLIR